LLKSGGVTKALQRPKNGRFNEIDVDVKYLINMWYEGIPIIRS
jgi:hypothetical protein